MTRKVEPQVEASCLKAEVLRGDLSPVPSKEGSLCISSPGLSLESHDLMSGGEKDHAECTVMSVCVKSTLTGEIFRSSCK